MFTLPKLPYAQDALAPTISKETFDFHYGKHHKTYIDNLNKLLETSPMKDASLEEITRKSSAGMFNNAAQSWNHTFYWYCLSPNKADQTRSAALDKALTDSFGSVEKFTEQFIAQGLANFGSGWTWLVSKGGKLSIENTSNAATPITTDQIPLLVVDVWEHAYYVDYRNARKTYLENFCKIINWKFVSERLESSEVFNCTKLMK